MLTPTAASDMVNVQQQLLANVTDSANGDIPAPGVNVTFTITGVGAQVLSAITDANGIAAVSFTSAAVGTSNVVASAPKAPSRTAVITWTQPSNSPPSCGQATVSPAALWPPNHKYVPITVTVPDVDGDPVNVTITYVYSSQPVLGTGDGNTCPDATLAPLQVRAERAGTDKTARFYRITFSATDGHANCSNGVVYVCVPHDAGTPCPSVANVSFPYDATSTAQCPKQKPPAATSAARPASPSPPRHRHSPHHSPHHHHSPSPPKKP